MGHTASPTSPDSSATHRLQTVALQSTHVHAATLQLARTLQPQRRHAPPSVLPFSLRRTYTGARTFMQSRSSSYLSSSRELTRKYVPSSTPWRSKPDRRRVSTSSSVLLWSAAADFTLTSTCVRTTKCGTPQVSSSRTSATSVSDSFFAQTRTMASKYRSPKSRHFKSIEKVLSRPGRSQSRTLPTFGALRPSALPSEPVACSPSSSSSPRVNE
mmetsp:Transcript_42233/g.119380  ORF Transcript_42233/g.119380 Transcript_42233/m.119380 type:complete len:214 (+) Transcript_42233:140-781(+)